MANSLKLYEVHSFSTPPTHYHSFSVTGVMMACLLLPAGAGRNQGIRHLGQLSDTLQSVMGLPIKNYRELFLTLAYESSVTGSKQVGPAI